MEIFDINAKVYKAQSVGESHAPSLQISISKQLPEFSTLEEVSERFKQQGKTLKDVLVQSLPGGTVDALLRELLQYRASHFVVPFEKCVTEEWDNNRVKEFTDNNNPS